MYSECLLSSIWLLVAQKMLLMTGSKNYCYISVYQLLIYLFCGFVGYGEKQCSSACLNGE